MLGSGGPERITTLQVQSESEGGIISSFDLHATQLLMQLKLLGKLRALYVHFSSRERKFSFHRHLPWFPTVTCCGPQALSHWASAHLIPLYPLPSALFTTLLSVPPASPLLPSFSHTVASAWNVLAHLSLGNSCSLIFLLLASSRKSSLEAPLSPSLN